MRGLFNDRPRKERLSPRDFDIAVDKESGKIWILHEKPFLNQGHIARAEYDLGSHFLRLVSRDGGIQYLGAAVKKPLWPYFVDGSEIVLILTDRKGNIVDASAVALEQAKAEKPVEKQG